VFAIWSQCFRYRYTCGGFSLHRSRMDDHSKSQNNMLTIESPVLTHTHPHSPTRFPGHVGSGRSRPPRPLRSRPQRQPRPFTAVCTYSALHALLSRFFFFFTSINIFCFQHTHTHPHSPTLTHTRQRIDPVDSRSGKKDHRLRVFTNSGWPQGTHWALRTYLSMAGQAENDKCWWWCGSGASQTRKHCSRWKDQRVTMWRDPVRLEAGDPEHLYGTALRRRKMHSGHLGVSS
jgi:hypothetical protein